MEYDSLSIPCFDTVGWVTGRACKKLGVGVFGGDDGGGGVKCSCRTCKARVIVPWSPPSLSSSVIVTVSK